MKHTTRQLVTVLCVTRAHLRWNVLKVEYNLYLKKQE